MKICKFVINRPLCFAPLFSLIDDTKVGAFQVLEQDSKQGFVAQ